MPNRPAKNVTPDVLETPALPATPADAPFVDTLRRAIEQRGDIDGFRFQSDEASDIAASALDFSGCMFERCAFADWAVKRLSFTDCVFDHCDLSAMRFENTSFQRVQFQDCRLTGADLLNCTLMNVVLTGCSADYLALSGCKLNHVRFTTSRLRESVWQDVKLKDTALDACDLTAAQVRFTPLAGLSFATCTLDGLQIDPHDLRGLRVTAQQALAMCGLFGLIVEE